MQTFYSTPRIWYYSAAIAAKSRIILLDAKLQQNHYFNLYSTPRIWYYSAAIAAKSRIIILGEKFLEWLHIIRIPFLKNPECDYPAGAIVTLSGNKLGHGQTDFTYSLQWMKLRTRHLSKSFLQLFSSICFILPLRKYLVTITAELQVITLSSFSCRDVYVTCNSLKSLHFIHICTRWRQ